jgi:hypothetical protein
MWNSSQKKPMLVIYSRGGGEKLIQIDAKQRPAEIEHLPVRLGQNYYARVARRRATLNSFPATAPAPPTNVDPTVIEDAAATTLREERPGGDEVQSAASRTLNHSAGATRRVAEVGTEHPDETRTALRARLNPEEEEEVAAAFRIIQTFRLPAPATGPKRRKRHGRPTVVDHFDTLVGEHQQQTGTTHAEAQSEAPSNRGTSVDGARPRQNQLNAGLLRPATEGAADPAAAAADQDVESDRVDDPGDDGMGHDWDTGREESEGRSGDRGCGGSAKRGDSSDGSDGDNGGSGSSGGGGCGGSDSGGSNSGGSDGSSTERGDGNGGSTGGSGSGSGNGSGGSNSG